MLGLHLQSSKFEFELRLERIQKGHRVTLTALKEKKWGSKKYQGIPFKQFGAKTVWHVSLISTV